MFNLGYVVLFFISNAILFSCSVSIRLGLFTFARCVPLLCIDINDYKSEIQFAQILY